MIPPIFSLHHATRLSEQAYGRDAKHLVGKQPLGAASGKPSYMVKAHLQQRAPSSSASADGNRPARPHVAAQAGASSGAAGAKPTASKLVAKAPFAAPTAAASSSSASAAADASLHPSWAARKQQKTTAAFAGQKVVFDD